MPHKSDTNSQEGVTLSEPACVSIHMYSFLTSLLEYNCFAMVCQFLLYNKVNQLYIYVCPHISSLLRLPPSHPPYFLINTLLVSLLSVSVGILFCKAVGPGSCHWPRAQWLGFDSLTTATQPQSPAGNRNPASSHCRPRPPEIRSYIHC